MGSQQQRLAAALANVLEVETEPDGALTLRHAGTLASLRVVGIADDLELVSLTQILGWELPLTDSLRDRVLAQAAASQLGTVALVARPGATADVMLRYNFPGAGLTDAALRTLVLLVLEAGAGIGRALLAD